jgi:light-regulated signal transduction histidine kinase (bacteriophytochrome)
MSVGSATPPRKGEYVTRPEGPGTERATDELSGALSIAAHDVTEAVRVVTGYLELFDAQAGQALDEGAQRYLGGVREGLDHLDRLMAGVLMYVRGCVDEHELEEIELDIALEDALRPLRDGLRERQARVVAEDLPVVRADAGRTRDLLRALASNAVTFAGAEPLVLEVAAERDRDGWQISVADNGIGMPEDAVERVFAPFERAHPRSVATGPGLGLAIARRIVECRGGRIWLETSDGGTTVRFTVPDSTDAR